MIVSYHWFVIWVQEKEGVLEEKEGNAQKGTLLLNIIVSPTIYNVTCCMSVEFQASRCFHRFRSDYLRLEGYAGALDTYYCGKGEKISIKLHKNTALKMTFKGQDRGSQYKNENDKRISEYNH